MLNLDTLSINKFSLGGALDKKEGNYESGYISYYVENSIIKNISVRFAEFYSKGKIYVDNVIVKTNELAVPIKPNDILPLYAEIYSHFDDGVEVNYQFKEEKVLLEFSWNKCKSGLELNYINLQFI
ncbi:hypothetical protein [Kangiella sp. HZ709]|uniref:hypothetical protein n=1 Tax=Kangiella sp. HZ709 TaxID=2666328 RepID=UPI0012AF7227|nr:hypothetical protein [Kangiella sp. HZ709]MRX27824.1 hypothetical protein [Kangiella sp. HZ709]